jgi:hypothetical protein
VFVTTDENLRYLQDLSKRRIAVVVLGHAQWPGLEPHASLVVAAIDRATPGGYEEVAILDVRPRAGQSFTGRT